MVFNYKKTLYLLKYLISVKKTSLSYTLLGI
jgi:hypothetical protein